MVESTPRLVATDLDGTIVRSDGSISARTAAALARVEAAGSALVMVTGRPPRWMGPVADAVDHHGLAICANGAVLYDLHTEEVVGASEIPIEALAEAITRLRAMEPGFRFAVEYPRGGFIFDGTFRLGRQDAERLGGTEVSDAELASRPATKLLALLPGGDPEELAHKVTEAVGDLVTVTYSSRGGLMEFSRLGVTKATALAALCTKRGIVAADVIAFGDMPNDLPMLTWAGRSYGVANAHPTVLAQVTGHTATNDEDGVAQVLETFFP